MAFLKNNKMLTWCIKMPNNIFNNILMGMLVPRHHHVNNLGTPSAM